jgi:5-methylcytosine-specific restriction protein A
VTDSATFTTPEAGEETGEDLGDLLTDTEKKPTHDPRYYWDREEHILLLNEYLRFTPRFPGKNSKEIEEISILLRRYHQQRGNPIHEHLRNANGVYMKLMNFRRFDPNTESKGLPKGNEVVWFFWTAPIVNL